MDMDFELYNPDLLEQPDPVLPRKQAVETSTYAALLSGQDPIAFYKQSMLEYETENNMRTANNVIESINKDTDIQRRAVMASIMNDVSLPTEDKQFALMHYMNHKEVYPPLRDVYAKRIAASSPAAEFNAEAYLNTFNTKEAASAVIQQEVQANAARLSGSTAGALSSFALSVAPFIWMGQNIYKGWTTAEMLEAVQGKDMGLMEKFWNSLWPGSNIQDIRETLDKLPATQRPEAAKKALAVIESVGNFDYDKYDLIKDAIDQDTIYTDWNKHADNLATLLGAAVGTWMVGSRSAFKVVPSKSVLGTTAAHNPATASAMVDAALDGSVPYEALGTDAAEVLASVLPKSSDDMLKGITPEASDKLRYIDEGGDRMVAAQSDNPLMYNRQVKDSVAERIRDMIANAKGMALHLGKSSVQSVDELGKETEMAFSGIATFGKDARTPFTSYEEATKAAAKFQKKVREGSVKVVSLGEDGKLTIHQGKGAPAPEGEYFVQWDWNHKFNPWDALLYGNDAVKLDFTVAGLRVPGLSGAADFLSKTPLGRYLFAHHAQPKAVTDTALRSFDKAVEMERPFTTGLIKHIASQSTKVREKLHKILDEGEESERIFTFEEVAAKGLAQGFSKKEAEALATSYIMYRRVGDWMYAALNKSQRVKDVQAGLKKIVFGEDISLNGKLISKGDVGDVRVFYNPVSDSFVPMTKKELDDLYETGGSIVAMKSSVRVGDDIVTMAVAKSGYRVDELDDFVLPYVKGYVPRFYEDPYFVVRIPAKATVNGVKVVDQSGLQNNSTVIASGRSKEEVEDIIERIKNDPEYDGATYEWKRDRASEKTMMEEASLFRDGLMHSRRRGEKPLDNAQKLDPLISMMNLVTSTSRYAAMDEFMTGAKESFKKAYDEFLPKENGLPVFPSSKDNFIKPKNMTGKQAAKYRQALAAYDYLESLMPFMRADMALWKEGAMQLAEASEKLWPVLAKAIRGVSDVGHPGEQLRRLATIFYINLRPPRQWLLQPSALAILMGQNIKYLNPLNILKFGRQVSSLQVAGMFYKTDTKTAKLMDDESLIAAFAKTAGMDVKEFKGMVEDLQSTGLLASVDTQSVVEGVLTSARTGLTETGLEKTGRVAKTIAEFMPKVGKRAGFDVGERFNLVGSWIIARERFMKMNPGADIRSSFAKEQIAADAREMALSMNRAGSFTYQRNILAIPLQFVAVPHKALLALTTSKLWTPAEKARMAATQFALYGAYGLGLYGTVTSIRDKYPDILSPSEWDLLTSGLLDSAANTLAHILLDEEGQQTQVSLSSSLSPLSGDYGFVPFSDILSAFNEKNFYQVAMGPSWNLVNEKGRIPKAITQISSLLEADGGITEDNVQQVLMMAGEVASMGTDYMKYRYALDSQYIVSASEGKVHAGATRAEAVGKMFGLQTKREVETYRVMGVAKDIEKAAQDDAKVVYDIYKKVLMPVDMGQPISQEELDIANKRVKAYLTLMKETDENRYINFLKHYRELERREAKDLETSNNLRIWRNAQRLSDEDRTALLNILRPYQELRNDLNDMTGSEDY